MRFISEAFAIVSVLVTFCLIAVSVVRKLFDKPRDDSHLCQANNVIRPFRLWLQMLAVVAASRFFLYLVGYVWFASTNDPYQLGNGFFNDFSRIFSLWDAPHYVDIAREGYVTYGEMAQWIVFYPLLPMLMKFISFGYVDLFFCGSLVSVVALSFAGYFVYMLTAATHPKNAWYAALFVILNPLTIFCSIAYTEALFLALTAGAAYYLRRNDWLSAAILSFLAAVTKNQGIILFVMVFVHSITTSANGKIDLAFIKSFVSKAWFSLFPIAGFGAYLSINYFVWGDCFKFLEFQKIKWYNQLGVYFETFGDVINNALTRDVFNQVAFIFVLEAAAFVLVMLLLLWAAFKKVLDDSLLSYGLVYVVISYSSTWIISGARYLSALFVPYMILALLPDRNGIIQKALIMASFGLSVLITVAYVQGYVL